MNTLPRELAWPACIYCDKPVTEAQQAIGAFRIFEGTGIAHRKCVKASVTVIEAQMVRT